MIIFRKLLLYYHTLRFLKKNQIVKYITFSIKNNIFKRSICKKITSSHYQDEPTSFTFVDKPHINNSHNLSERSFTFLNHTECFGNKIRWHDPDLPKLWLYNLHYFDYLIQFESKYQTKSLNTKRDIISDWIYVNSIGYKNGWEPYPLSLRIVNWIIFYCLSKDYFNSESEFKHEFLNSLYKQCVYLEYFLEYHIRANHLFKNGKALLVAGLFFNKNEWIKKGEKIIFQEIEEQILDDGGHYERSPMYHSIIAEDLLDILNLFLNAQIEGSLIKIEGLKPIIQKMLIWMEKINQPDNDIPLFGDSALNIALRFDLLAKYYQQIFKNPLHSVPSSTIESLDSSGYFIFRSSDQYLVVDGGELGVSYQPGHAHCDFLSFEYSYRGKRFIVDSGPGEYLDTKLRRNSRSIYGHNCAVINGLDQGEIWQTFRMGRRIHPDQVHIKRIKNNPTFEGSYKNNLSRTLSYSHKRELSFVKEKFFVIKDSIHSKRINHFENLIHLSENCQVEQLKNAVRILQNEEIIYITYEENKIRISIDDWIYTPEFGHHLNSKVIILESTNPVSGTMSYIISPEIYFNDSLGYLNSSSDSE